MKNKKVYYLFTLLILFLWSPIFANRSKEKPLNISNIELAYPSPSIPFYHFNAELELPHASIMEVVAEVNGKALRFLDLHRSDELKDKNRPPLSHRPPSGYGLSQDGTLYHHPHVVGWMQ